MLAISKKSTYPIKLKSVFLHEDFYNQIQLIPSENLFTTTKEIDFISDENPMMEGGFNECFARESERVKIESRKISFEEIKSILDSSALAYSNQLEMGYGKTVYTVEDAQIWGFERYGIVVESSHNLVKKIWLCSNSAFSKENTATTLSKMILSLGQKFDLILADWNYQIAIRLTSDRALVKYLSDNLRFNLV